MTQYIDTKELQVTYLYSTHRFSTQGVVFQGRRVLKTFYLLCQFQTLLVDLDQGSRFSQRTTVKHHCLSINNDV